MAQNKDVESRRLVQYVEDGKHKLIVFYMLYKVTITMRVKYVKKDFLRRYCTRMMFPIDYPRWALPIRY